MAGGRQSLSLVVLPKPWFHWMRYLSSSPLSAPSGQLVG
jgi:hypothetical protein